MNNSNKKTERELNPKKQLQCLEINNLNQISGGGIMDALKKISSTCAKYNCPTCDEGFNSAIELWSHTNSCLGPVIRSFGDTKCCLICGVEWEPTTYGKNSFAIHVTKNHRPK